MKIIFFGTSDFAVSAINALSLSKHRILAVVTAADKKRGRGQRIGSSPVKIVAEEKDLYILQPQDLRDIKFIQCLQKMRPDLFVVAAYGKILTKQILRIPTRYAINLHASLLPKYRGAAPINWAIIKAEKETGVTVFRMNKFMDKGEIILQGRTPIRNSDTSVSLSERLSEIAAKLLLNSLGLIEKDKVAFIAQDESRASLAPKLKKDDGLIDWQSSARDIYNRIRGLQPWPCAFTYLENKLLKIWESKIVEGKKDRKGGEIVNVDEKEGILVQTEKNRLLITSLQLEGKKRMSAHEFILGHNIKTGERLGSKS